VALAIGRYTFAPETSTEGHGDYRQKLQSGSLELCFFDFAMKFVKLRIVVWNCCWMLMLFGGSTFAGVDFKPEIRGQYQSACPIQAITIFSVGADPRSLTLME
jgi:hypothetical protein